MCPGATWGVTYRKFSCAMVARRRVASVRDDNIWTTMTLKGETVATLRTRAIFELIHACFELRFRAFLNELCVLPLFH